MDDKIDEVESDLQSEANQANTPESEESKDLLTDEELEKISGGQDLGGSIFNHQGSLDRR